MSKKVTRAGESNGNQDDLYMAHHVHTLAQMLVQHLAGSWGAPRPFGAAPAESFPPQMSASPWGGPTSFGAAQAEHFPTPMGGSPWGASWPEMGAAAQAPAPRFVSMPPQTLVYWYP